MTEKEIFLEKELIDEEFISLEVEEVVKIIEYPELKNLEVIPTKEIQNFNHADAYGYDNVQVNAIPNEYIIPNGTLEVSKNGDVDVTNFKMARIGVYTPPNLQDKFITITQNGTINIVVDEGYDGLNNVEVTTNISSGETPEKGFVVNEWDSNGYPTNISIVGMTSIPSYGFAYGTSYATCFTNSLANVNLPSTVSLINSYAFKGLTTLKTVTFSEGLSIINNGAFREATNLNVSELPSTVTKINREAFYKCNNSNLKKIPDEVTALDVMTFGQNKFSQISMSNVSTINGGSATNGCFANCTNLKGVWIGSSITDSGFSKHAFTGSTNVKKMFIDLPREMVEAFTNYTYVFANNTISPNVIICNDDEGFMTQEEFDLIDWSIV